MGRYAEAEAAYGRARTLWDDLAGKWPDQPDYVERRLAIRTHLGFLGYVSHRPAEADRILSEGLALSREWAARLPVEPRHQSRLAYLHRCHALVRAALGQPDRQEESFRAAVALFEDLVGRQPEEVEYLAGLGVTLNDLGIMHAQANHPEPAQAAWARARTVLETLARNHPANGDYQNAVANLSNNLGALLFAALHRPEEAMAVLLQTRPVAERLVHDFPQVAEYRYHRGNLHLNLSLTYLDLGRYAEARALADQVIGLLEEERGRPAQEASSRALLGEWYGRRAFALAHLERHDEGQRDLDRALAVCPEGQRAHFRTFRDLLTAARRLAEGDYFQAAAQAHTVAGQAADDPALTVWAAELLRGSLAAAQHAPDLPADQRAALADQYGRWAVEALDRARAAGYFTVGRRAAALAHGPAWEGLRGRPDFQRLAGAVGASPAPP
jgi:tetratricopeptide (TPR) repeat protein